MTTLDYAIIAITSTWLIFVLFYIIKSLTSNKNLKTKNSMKEFSLNKDIYVQITTYGWAHLHENFDKSFTDAIVANRTIIDDREWYRVQAHTVITLFGGCSFSGTRHPIKPIIKLSEGY